MIPPKLLPEESASSGSIDTCASSVAVSDILLRILSKLTVYQSLPENSTKPVVAVKDDVPLVDALMRLLPGPDSGAPILWIEVLSSDSPFESAKDLLMEKSRQLFAVDELLSKAFQAEATRLESATDELVGDFLSVHDLCFFVKRFGEEQFSVKEWIALKRRDASKSDDADPEWIRFCWETVLLRRTSLSMSPGLRMRKNSVLSSSTMNMSVSSLLKQSTSMGDLIAPGSHSMYWKSQLRTARMGGSSLVAVCNLLNRPWQASLPLTVHTEKGIEGVFGYITLAQLMAHVAMNCSDKLLEPFFSMEVGFEEFASVAAEHLEVCPVLHHSIATLSNAIDVLATSPFALLSSRSNGTLKAVVSHDEVLALLADKCKQENSPSLSTMKLSDLIGENTSAVATMKIAEFPCPFSLILQNILLSRQSALVVVSMEDIPMGIITVRDVWNYVMQGATVLRE